LHAVRLYVSLLRVCTRHLHGEDNGLDELLDLLVEPADVRVVLGRFLIHLHEWHAAQRGSVCVSAHACATCVLLVHRCCMPDGPWAVRTSMALTRESYSAGRRSRMRYESLLTPTYPVGPAQSPHRRPFHAIQIRVHHMPGVMPHVGPAVARAVCQRRVEGRLHSRDARRAHEQAWGARRHACTRLRRMAGEAYHAPFMPGRGAGRASRQCAGCGEISALLRIQRSALVAPHTDSTGRCSATQRHRTQHGMPSSVVCCQLR
jgi:hypothetical protein